jgi:chromosome segregation ATPase
MTRTTGTLTVAVVLLAGWTAARGQAQTPAAAAPADIMPALLEEIRGLRSAMEQMSSAGPRVQLALGRLQLQEQRITNAIRRADDARTRLAGLHREQAEMQQRLRSVEMEFKERQTRAGADGPTAEQIAGMLDYEKQGLARHNAEVQRVAAEEAVYANEVATEQARWTEINQRLEDLERMLRPLK